VQIDPTLPPSRTRPLPTGAQVTTEDDQARGRHRPRRERPDGTWGAGGMIIRYADLVALANPTDAGNVN
jgi:hypothetical protein